MIGNLLCIRTPNLVMLGSARTKAMRTLRKAQQRMPVRDPRGPRREGGFDEKLKMVLPLLRLLPEQTESLPSDATPIEHHLLLHHTTDLHFSFDAPPCLTSQKTRGWLSRKMRVEIAWQGRACGGGVVIGYRIIVELATPTRMVLANAVRRVPTESDPPV
jgi:hypothetical protein